MFSQMCLPIDIEHNKTTVKAGTAPVLTVDMVGVAGLEPAASWSRTMHATNCATPRITVFYYSVMI